MTRALALVVLLGGGCATPIASPAPLTGQWGGQHVGVSFGTDLARVEYDCGAGTMTGPVRPSAGGAFEADGTHAPGQGGPERVGFTPRSFPARYSGSVRGDTMTLVVDVAAIGARIGPYRLRRNAPPMLLRCL